MDCADSPIRDLRADLATALNDLARALADEKASWRIVARRLLQLFPGVVDFNENSVGILSMVKNSIVDQLNDRDYESYFLSLVRKNTGEYARLSEKGKADQEASAAVRNRVSSNASKIMSRMKTYAYGSGFRNDRNEGSDSDEDSSSESGVSVDSSVGRSKTSPRKKRCHPSNSSSSDEEGSGNSGNRRSNNKRSRITLAARRLKEQAAAREEEESRAEFNSAYREATEVASEAFDEARHSLSFPDTLVASSQFGGRFALPADEGRFMLKAGAVEFQQGGSFRIALVSFSPSSAADERSWDAPLHYAVVVWQGKKKSHLLLTAHSNTKTGGGYRIGLEETGPVWNFPKEHKLGSEEGSSEEESSEEGSSEEEEEEEESSEEKEEEVLSEEEESLPVLLQKALMPAVFPALLQKALTPAEHSELKAKWRKRRAQRRAPTLPPPPTPGTYLGRLNALYKNFGVTCTNGRVNIDQFHIRKDLRGRGLGRVCMAVLLAWIHAHAAGAPVTVTSPTAEGRKFYQRLGFNASARTMGDLVFCPLGDSETSNEEEDDSE